MGLMSRRQAAGRGCVCQLRQLCALRDFTAGNKTDDAFSGQLSCVGKNTNYQRLDAVALSFIMPIFAGVVCIIDVCVQPVFCKACFRDCHLH